MALTKAVTKYGTVVGVPVEGCTAFKGVPFAQPPVGELRFKAPVEPAPWEGEKLCDTFAPACIQLQRMAHGPAPKMAVSEDCLYMNIWTPAESAGKKLPVMFWVYGGGFQGGNAADPGFYGNYMAAMKDVVVVTFNYRCGPLGYFSLPQWGESSGNFGILDQAAAIKWVYENIEAFGGDPERILVFGQSAGGVSVRMLLCSPITRHMVRRAVVQSGGGLNEADPVRPADEYKKLCQETLDELGWTEADIMSCDPVELTEKLNEAGGKVLARYESGRIVGVFQPYIDGYTLPDVPGIMIANGDYNMDADVICGVVSGDDWMFSRKVQQSLPEEITSWRPFSLIPGFAWGRHQLKTGRKPIRTYYFEKERIGERKGPMYRPGIVPHSSDIAYVFGTYRDQERGHDALDEQFSQIMMSYWTNFAKTGDPNGEGLPQWPLFTQDCQKAIHFDNEGVRMDDLLTEDVYVRLMDYTEEHPGMLMNLDGFEK